MPKAPTSAKANRLRANAASRSGQDDNRSGARCPLGGSNAYSRGGPEFTGAGPPRFFGTKDMTTDSVTTAIDANDYRQVLGQYPTGVCAITATGPEGEPVAMIVGSFSSVSLSPPLVGFFPDKASSSWGKLRRCDHFCVNILGAHQQDVCRRLASKDPDKFVGTPHDLSSRGAPRLDDVVARIECVLHSITDAGDHELVLGEVIGLDVISDHPPLLFHRGRYGAFSPE